MQRRKLGFWGSSALSWTLGLAVAGACNVYDSSLLTGGSGAEGGTSGEGGSAAGGNGGSKGGAQGGGSAGTGTGGNGGSGASGGTEPTGGTGSGGNAGTTGNTGGTDPTGGDGGDPGTGGDGGSAAGSGGKGGTAGDGGSGMTGGSGGSGGSAGDGGSGGACGKCGCGKADTPDTDMDGVLDCVDMCMGYADADCAALRGGLVHRYSFDGTGTAVMDTKGTAHGTAVNATLSGTGTLTLSGGNTSTPPYVNLPNGIISALTNATFEVWLTWNQSGTTGQNWQRIFDFGTSGTEDMQASAGSTSMSYLFLTTRASTSPTVVRAAFTTTGPTGETVVNGSAALATGSLQQVVVAIDDQNDMVSLYVNGAFQATSAFSGQLSTIVDVNNWLGRSQFATDYELIGVYNEVRIYNVALTSAQVRTSFMAGANAAFF
jgi:hypothetical protein